MKKPKTKVVKRRRCNEAGCDNEATEHRPGFGSHWWKCKEHDEQSMNAVRGMQWLCD